MKIILNQISIVLGITLLIFVLFNIMGNPSESMLGQRTDIQTKKIIEENLNIAEPLHRKLTKFIINILPVRISRKDVHRKDQVIILYSNSSHEIELSWPNIGSSLKYKQDAMTIVVNAFWRTMILASTCIVIALIAGILLPMLLITINSTILNNTISTLRSALLSTPNIIIGLIILLITKYLWTNVYLTGYIYEKNIYSSEYDLSLAKIIAPAICLSLRPLLIISQILKSDLEKCLESQYIKLASLKGINKWKVYIKHALPNTYTQIISTSVTWYALLLTGSILIEVIFEWPGIGMLAANAILFADYPLLIGICLLTGTIFSILNTLQNKINNDLTIRN